MSDRTFGRKKAGTSTFSNPSLVSPTTPTLANPVRGFGLPTNNVIQTATKESTNLQQTQAADEQSLLSEAIHQRSFGHDISRIAFRRPQAKLTVGAPNDVYEQEADRVADQVGCRFPENNQNAMVQSVQIASQLSFAPVSVLRKPPRGRTPKTGTALKSDFVKAEVAKGRFKDLPSDSSSQGGAFWMLNGLNPEEMHEVLRLCGKSTRSELLAHIDEADGLFDRPRLESALRASTWGEKKSGVTGLELMDAIRNAGVGSFTGVWGLLTGKSRLEVIGVLRTLPRTMLTQLQTKLSDSSASDSTKFAEVISDLLGTGTNMQASDIIDLEGLSGLDRVMANIYNIRGQSIEERARNLGVPTHAAAGIMKVESGGATFSQATDKTIIRFENHVFWHEWGRFHPTDFNLHFDFNHTGDKFKGHRFRELPTGSWEVCHQNQEQEWRIMEFAALLSNMESAYRSASWGAGQIMGFNAGRVGYASAVDMANEFNRAERPQVTGIFEFIRANGLAPAVVRGDYLTVASRYNGTGQAHTYASLIQNAAQAYQRVTTGKKHVIP